MNYPVYKPYLHGNERKYVNECIDSTWISSKGNFIKQFEESFSALVDVNHSLTVCNGTSAIHLALMTLGVGNGDQVIVPTLTYIATVNPVVFCGATPVFTDCRTDWQIDPDEIEKNISPSTKAIIVVHLYGHPCEMNTIIKIALKNKLFVIEDCCEAFGSYYDGRHVGTFGDIGCFSFFGNKTITTGEGGMLVTNRKDYYQKALKLKSQGIADYREYFHDELGYNYRMTNIQAAIGLAQLEMTAEICKRKEDIARWYKKYLTVPMLEGTGLPWMVCIMVNDRDDLRSFLSDNGIETRPVFPCIHLMPIYNTGQELPVAELISEHGVNLPSYPELLEGNVMEICDKINEWKLQDLGERMLWWKTM